MSWCALVGVTGLAWGLAGCEGTTCNLILYRGNEVQVALVDEEGNPANARGKVQYSQHQTLAFDCGVAPEADLDDIDCVDGVLELEAVYNPDDTIDIVFLLADGSWAAPQPVQLDIEREVVNEGECEQTVYNGTTEPVTVPAEAKVDDG